LQHQKVIINTLNTDNFNVQTKIDAFSPEDSAADMTRLKAEYNIFPAKSEEEAHHFLQLETAVAMLGSDKSRAQKLIRGIHGPRPKTVTFKYTWQFSKTASTRCECFQLQ
jgi:hypothetical protein